MINRAGGGEDVKTRLTGGRRKGRRWGCGVREGRALMTGKMRRWEPRGIMVMCNEP